MIHTLLRSAALLLIGVMFWTVVGLAIFASVTEACEPESPSQWAPGGWVCEARYGVGTASTWGGPGAAVNSCVWPWTDCQTIAVRSLDTGIVIVVTPSMFCHCWVGVTGPNGETERLVDLGPELVSALGLPGPGLYPVEVQPFREGASSNVLPDTAMEAAQ